MATENRQGGFEWWAGRLAALERKASGEGSKRWVRLLDPVLFEEAKQSQMQVYCDWYTKHACGVFMLNGPLDDKPYAMTSVLGILDLDLPDARGKYKLRDLAQGARLNQVLDLLKPELRAGSKRTQGEATAVQKDAVAQKRQRENSRKEDEGVTYKTVERAQGKRVAKAARR